MPADPAPAPQPTPPAFPWLLTAGLLLPCLALAWFAAEAELGGKRGPPPALDAARWALAVGPVLALIGTLFHPRALAALRGWSSGQLSLLTGWVGLWMTALPALRFDPYAPAIVAAAAAACPAVLCGRASRGLGADGLLVWMLLWIPFDLRWYGQGLWLTGGGYAAWALGITLVALLSFGGAARCGELGVRPPPGWARGLGRVLLELLVFAAVAIGIGVASGFLHPHREAALDLRKAALEALGLFLTVALPEELFFRGLLDAGLRARWGGTPALLVSSFAFGLMHWNNRDDPVQAGIYVGLASLAGLFYARSFRRGGLLVAVTMHTLVDLIWKVFLRK